MAGFAATHSVPAGGLSAFAAPDGSGPSVATLDPRLEVQVVERSDDWARIVCSNGWSAWVDGRQLLPAANAVEDSFPQIDDDLTSALAAALARYAVLVDDLNAGRIDHEAFRRAAFRSGLVVRDSEAWILDLSTECWWRYDGLALSTIVPAEPTMGED